MTILLSLILALCGAAGASEFTVASVEGGALTVNGRAASAGTALDPGAVVRLDSGKAVLDFGAEGRLWLTGPADFTVASRGLSVSRGGLLSMLNKLTGAFTVETPAAVAAVRGTKFYIEPRGEERTYLCVCKGKLEVASAGGFKTKMKSADHKAAVFARSGDSVTQTPAGREGH